MRDFQIAVFEGDGIGPEVMAPTLALLQGLSDASSRYSLHFNTYPAGAGHYGRLGEAMPAGSVAGARAADAILLSAMGLPGVQYPDRTEIRPQIDLRVALDLYAGVRPIRIPKGLRTRFTPLGEGLDIVVIRESTEGLFHSQRRGYVASDHALETLKITRATSEKLFEFAFSLARRRKARGLSRGGVTCVGKSNVFRAFAFFREIFDEVAAQHTDLKEDHAYVDGAALLMVTQPSRFDVLVTENMFGDILSGLGAGLLGGHGLAPSADIGADHAMFQPSHGSAMELAGLGWANPLAMILSASMMLDWLGMRSGEGALCLDALRLQNAVDRVLIAGRVRTRDLGGSASTLDMALAVGEDLAAS